ncbi:MAG: hypothetical protein AB4352_05130 [Hormoscilla sp.]
MCFGCLMFSTLTLFIPAPEPAPMTTGAAVVSEAGYSQVEQYDQVDSITAGDVQKAIAAMLKEIPNTEEMSFLRQELKSLQAEMATLDRDTDVEDMLDDKLQEIQDRVLSAPGSEQVMEVLMSMLIIDDGDPGVKALGKRMLSLPKNKLHLTSTSPSWGWLN